MRNAKRPRISAAQIAEIRRQRARGLRLKEIADALGVSINSACRHGKAPPPRRRSENRIEIAAASDFIRPPSLARLMAGR